MTRLAVGIGGLALCLAGETRAADIVLETTVVGDRVKVQINKRSTNPAAHSIQYFARETGVVFTPGSGAVDDPIANGAEAVVFSATDCQCLTLAPSPSVVPGWSQVPASGTPTKYKWKDDATRSTAQVKAGKIKLKKKGGIGYGLDATPQGEVEFRIVFGVSPDRFCSRFQAPSGANDSSTKYRATAVVPISTCSDIPAHCPCAPPPSTSSTSSTTSTTTSSTETTTTTSTTTSSTETSTSTSTTSSTTSTTSSSTSTTSTTSTTLPCPFVTAWGTPGSGTGQFGALLGVAVDAAGDVYTLESTRVQKFDNSGTFILTWGSIGSADGQFVGQGRGVEVDGSGNVYVTDNSRVQKFTSTGTFLLKFGSGTVFEPNAVAPDALGNVFIGDQAGGNGRIHRFSDTGSFFNTWGIGTGPGSGGLAADGSGNVYVAASVSFEQRVRLYSSTGGVLAEWGSNGGGDGQFIQVAGAARNGAGDVFVADAQLHRVQRFTGTGTFVAKWGSNGTGPGQFINPGDVAVDASNNVFVVDATNKRIQKFACP